MAKVEPEIESTKPEDRKCKEGLLNAYLGLTEDHEAKEIYHLWTAISIVSSALGRKCYIDRGHWTLYPNHYIVLIGDSGSRKSSAANYGVKLYKEAKLEYLYKGTITMRALSKRMHKTFEDDLHSSVFLYSPELHKMLGSNSYVSGLMTFLTDFYDCPDYDEYETSTQGKDVHESVFINLLGCTVPNWLAEMPKIMIEGGFSGRSIFVVEEGPRRAVAWPEEKEYQLREDLIFDLQQIGKLYGCFELTKEAREFFRHWYESVHFKQQDVDMRLKSFHSRKGEHALKLAMCINASRSNEMMIDEHDIKASLAFLDQIEIKLPDAFSVVAYSEETKYNEMVRKEIEKAGRKIGHSALLKKMWYYAKASTVKEILSGMEEQGMVKHTVEEGKRYWKLL